MLPEIDIEQTSRLVLLYGLAAMAFAIGATLFFAAIIVPLIEIIDAHKRRTRNGA